MKTTTKPWLLLFGLLATLMSAGSLQASVFFLSCGSNSSIDAAGRRWVGDAVEGTNFTITYPGLAASSSASPSGDSVFESLYRSCRLFNLPSSYSFAVVPGSYCLRLHFSVFEFGDYAANASAFDVAGNDVKLLSGFKFSDELLWRRLRMNSTSGSVVKEYFLGTDRPELVVTFVPNPGSFAFVNAIEIIPSPENLFNGSISKVSYGGGKLMLTLQDRWLETMYRVNVGGPELTSDSDGYLWREWSSDKEFMFSVDAATATSNSSNISYVSSNEAAVAPLLVYETARIMSNNGVVEKRFNVSWRFYIHPSFEYVVRLHFCELMFDKPSQRVFNIFVDNKTAAENYDVFVRAGGVNKAYHEDFFDGLPMQIDTLWVQLGPDSVSGASGTDALLNGLEVFKLSKNGNLGYSLDLAGVGENASSRSEPGRKVLFEAVIIGMAAAVSVIVTVFAACCWLRKKRAVVKEAPPGWHPLVCHENTASIISTGTGVSITVDGGRRFSLVEIRAATCNFDESLVIGVGGFGKVYKGVIDSGDVVAVKRANPHCQQGLKEFETEITMLSKLRHRHLVTLIGFCDEQKEMILVYEFMANGPLRSHLYGDALPALSWKQRVEVCIGAARGLHYLHTGSADRGIIHRDVKTTNILLDENFIAKMSDFGLSKVGPTLDHTHVSTAVKGSFGYLDPEYFRRQQLTQKSDVYSFGVVLFEVVCARPVIDPTLPKDQINLAEWALRWQRQRSLETIADPRIKGDCSLESLKKFGEIAEKCLADDGKNRPTMGEVLWHLEYVLQLHDAYKQNSGSESFGSSELRFTDMPLALPHIGEGGGEPPGTSL